jgi:hypothetical protein
MKPVFAFLFICCSNAVLAQQHSLEKIWETDAIVAVPESVLPHKKKVMYVSLIDGSPWEADGKGGVGRIHSKGKDYEGGWITGLNAPKGMGLKGKELYVADLGEVVVIDTKKGGIKRRIAVPGATGLNDVTVSDAGSVYVSDSRTGRIWKIDGDVPVLFLDSVQGVNGLKAVGSDLMVAAGKSFNRVTPDKKVITLANLPQGGDGIEPIGNGDFLVTSWSGYIFYVSANGNVETLLNTSSEKRNAADIGYDPKKRIVYVPTFNAKTVAAYRLH